MSFKTLRKQLRWKYISEKIQEPNALIRFFARKLIPLTQPAGFSIIADHFYEPVPNIAQIQRCYNDLPREIAGFQPSSSWTESFEEIVRPFLNEYINSTAYQQCGRKNYFYSGWDAAYYYCLLRHEKPRSIVEIGRGFSTRIAGFALEMNAGEGHPGELVSIDPFYRNDPVSQTIRVIKTQLQQISPAQRDEFLRSDILFIDSSHVVKWGSDTLELFQHWLPNVAVNTLVHIHDICTPYDYPKDWLVNERRFWNEQYFFESFIAHNESYRIECPIFYLGKNGVLSKIAHDCNAPDLSKKSGGAMWLKRCK